jgi:hypothetical protein
MPDPTSGTVDIPKVGKVKKMYVWAALGGVGLFVGWRYYQAAKGSAGGTTPPVTGDVGAPVDPSGVVGAPASGNVQYAGTTTDATATQGEPRPGNFSNNAEWTNYAINKLVEQGRPAASVGSALGDYLAKRPLDTSEEQIVVAALAIAGAPPVGGPYSIVRQLGTVNLTAPTGLKVSSVATTSAWLTFNPVPGAVVYYVYRSGITENVGGSRDTKIQVTGLSRGTSYKFAVQAVAATGKGGPKSGYITVTTKK